MPSIVASKIFLAYLLFVNAASFGLFAWDKNQARRGGWRIQERTLFLWAILGGAWGGLLGMYILRHKTRHPQFTWGFPLICLLQTALLIYLYTS